VQEIGNKKTNAKNPSRVETTAKTEGESSKNKGPNPMAGYNRQNQSELTTEGGPVHGKEPEIKDPGEEGEMKEPIINL